MKFFVNCILTTVCALACTLNASEGDAGEFESMHPVVTGTVNVGTDNLGAPIELAFKSRGKNDGRPVIVFCDPYVGIESWKRQQKVFSRDYYTIAYDPIGFGLSSKNDPTALDGVYGHAGYSYRQQAAFLHKLFETLEPNGPIIFVAVDIQGQVGVWYATDYANDTYPITKLLMEDSSADAIVSDDPCSLAYLDVTSAQQLVGLFSIDPATAGVLLLGDSFLTTNCPAIEPVLINITVDYLLTTTPDIFARTLLGTFTEDVSPLMANISIPVLNTYGTTGDNHPVSRRGVGITLVGSGNWTNPLIPGDCDTCNHPAVLPFPDSRFITFPGHGTIVHLTACRKFNRELSDFITGEDAACSICVPLPEGFDSSIFE